MTLLEYLEDDRERFENALSDAATTSKCLPVIANESDRLLMKFNENCDDPARREAAAYMLQTARLAAAFADTTGKINVWEKKNSDKYPAGKEKERKSSLPIRSGFMLLLSILCGIGSFMLAFLNSTEDFRVTDFLLALILAAFAVILALYAGKFSGNNKEVPDRGHWNMDDFTLEKQIDVPKVYTALHNLVYAIDRNLDQLSPAVQGSSNSGSSFGPGAWNLSLSEQEIGLCAGLLEAEYSGDTTYMLDQLNEVKLFLHRNKIEAVDYDGKNALFFDFMPAGKTKTLRPALISEGKILKRGLATDARR